MHGISVRPVYRSTVYRLLSVSGNSNMRIEISEIGPFLLYRSQLGDYLSRSYLGCRSEPRK